MTSRVLVSFLLETKTKLCEENTTSALNTNTVPPPHPALTQQTQTPPTLKFMTDVQLLSTRRNAGSIQYANRLITYINIALVCHYAE